MTAARTRLLALAKSEPPRRWSGGRFTADVLAQRVDLIGRHVQLVVALVGEQQVVALDPADRALDHALVPPDAVLEVDDVHPRTQVLEDPDAVARGAGVGGGGRGGDR